MFVHHYVASILAEDLPARHLQALSVSDIYVFHEVGDIVNKMH